MTATVMILAGGLSHERDVSIRSGRRVAEALRAVGVEAVVHDLDQTLLDTLRSQPPACVIPLVHGASGEDGSLREVLDSLGVPYVGAEADACRLAFDKMVAKAHLAGSGIRTAPAVALPHPTFRDLGARAVLDALVGRIGLPLVVKPTRGGSALGVAIVRDPADLPGAMVGCFSYGDTAMLERFVPGTEVAVSVIEQADGTLLPLPAVEIRPDAGSYDFASRYTAGTTEFFAPARLSQDTADECARVAVLAHEGLGLRHLSRADLIVTPEGEVIFLEVNVAPGCTETSLLPQAVAAAGLDLGAVFATLIDRALAGPRPSVGV
ncbi:MAG: D-alanine--D-alanine ligase [Candidatus Nanopelagicales bacterium]|nr:D-alanine--D-alanine ligase [Candidatus Nanopelagicales bacterium]